MSKELAFPLLCFLLVSGANSARILGVFQMPSLSHQIVFQPIWRELSLRGHQVTVVTPNPLKDPTLTNLTEIDVSYTYEIINRHGFQYFMSKENAVWKKVPRIFSLNNELAEAIFKNEEFKRIYTNPNEKFDLILVQCYVSPIMYSLAAKFGAPVIGIASMGGWVGSHYSMGNPSPPSVYSEMFLPYNGELNFVERFLSASYSVWSRYYINYHGLPSGDKIVKKYLGQDMPYLGESDRNVSMLFLSTNPILYTPRPTVPTIISLNSMHLKPTKPLPKDLKKELDDAKEGVVYFSLGSNVKSVNISTSLRSTLMKTFAELPYKVLWKFESDVMPNKPANVIIRKWLPQQDVLAHPNIKLFITQCGLQSIEEAISRGIPMVGMPFIADQPMNIKRLSEEGAALGVDYLRLTKSEFKRVILEVVNNKKYRDNVLRLKSVLNDEPTTALEKAVWWSEYVIRHKGTKHLRTPLVDISWIDYLLLDVIGFILILVLISCYVSYRLIKLIAQLFVSKNVKTKLN